jgi:hypothetical protein
MVQKRLGEVTVAQLVKIFPDVYGTKPISGSAYWPNFVSHISNFFCLKLTLILISSSLICMGIPNGLYPSGIQTEI